MKPKSCLCIPRQSQRRNHCTIEEADTIKFPTNKSQKNPINNLRLLMTHEHQLITGNIDRSTVQRMIFSMTMATQYLVITYPNRLPELP
jgi:hypothetical protein